MQQMFRKSDIFQHITSSTIKSSDTKHRKEGTCVLWFFFFFFFFLLLLLLFALLMMFFLFIYFFVCVFIIFFSIRSTRITNCRERTLKIIWTDIYISFERVLHSDWLEKVRNIKCSLCHNFLLMYKRKETPFYFIPNAAGLNYTHTHPNVHLSILREVLVCEI